MVSVPQAPAWRLTGGARAAWLERHLGVLLQMAALIAGGLVLLAFRPRGATATLMMLALVGSGVANGGQTYGSERALGPLSGAFVFLVWCVTPLVFSVIGLAILHFPRRADILDGRRWILAALLALALPMLVNGVAAAAFLVGLDAALPALTWLATRR